MSNEITVRLKCNIKEMCNLLENKNFIVTDEYCLNDTYFIPKELDLENITHREIISKAIILREITETMSNQQIVKLVFKTKQIDINGDILSQKKYECEILNVKDGETFINSIGYKKLMTIKEYDKSYERDDFKITIKDVENGEKLIEIETVEDNKELDTIEKIKDKVNQLKLPLDTNDYFVKKAEIALKNILLGGA